MPLRVILLKIFLLTIGFVVRFPPAMRTLRSMVTRLAILASLAETPELYAWTNVDAFPGFALQSRVFATSDGSLVLNRGSRVVQFDGVTGAEQWHRDWHPNLAQDVAVTTGGDVVASGEGTNGVLRVTKYAGADGADLWTYDEGTAQTGIGLAVALAPDGDAVGTGMYLSTPSAPFQMLVVRLDGATGAVVWRELFPELRQSVAVAVGADDHPVVVGMASAEFGGWSRVKKLDGATGDVLWDTAPASACGPASVQGVAVHPDGGVLVAGTSCVHSASTRSFTVTKLDGSTGAPLWQVGVDPPSGAVDVAPFAKALEVLPTGDIVAGGALDIDPYVLALSPAGTVLWSWSAHDAKTPQGLRGVFDLAVDGTGDVVATARLGRSGIVARLDGASGAESWRRGFRLEWEGGAYGVATDASNDVAVAVHGSYLVNQGLVEGVYGLAKLRGADGESFVGTRCGSAVCGRCERCDAPDVCVAGPRLDCRVPVAANASLLQLRDGSTPALDRLLWKWNGPPASLPVELGDPRLHDDETLCVWEDTAATPALVYSDTLGALEDCGSKACWRRSGPPDKPTFGYSASKFSVKLTAGPGKKSRFQWKASGATVGIPALGLVTPARAELRSSNGICWAAAYDAGVVKNTPTEFKAKGGSS